MLCYFILDLFLREAIDAIHIDWSYFEIEFQGHYEKVGITLSAIYFDLGQLVI